jgi:hypothetical protein
MENIALKTNDDNRINYNHLRKVGVSFVGKRSPKEINYYNDFSYDDFKKIYSHEVSENYISHESKVSFIIDYGIKILKDESETRIKLMLANHRIIEFYGVRYFVPLFRYNYREEKIFNHFIENNA